MLESLNLGHNEFCFQANRSGGEEGTHSFPGAWPNIQRTPRLLFPNSHVRQGNHWKPKVLHSSHPGEMDSVLSPVTLTVAAAGCSKTCGVYSPSCREACEPRLSCQPSLELPQLVGVPTPRSGPSLVHLEGARSNALAPLASPTAPCESHGSQGGRCGLSRSRLGGTSTTPGWLLVSRWASGGRTGIEQRRARPGWDSDPSAPVPHHLP